MLDQARQPPQVFSRNLDLPPTADPPACARKITALHTHAPNVGGSCLSLAATYLQRLILQMIHCLDSLAPLNVKCDLEWEHSLISLGTKITNYNVPSGITKIKSKFKIWDLPTP